MKKGDAIALNNVLAQSKLGDMSAEGKGAVIRTKVELSRVCNELEEVKRETVNGLRTPGFDLLQSKSKEVLTETERTELLRLTDKLNREFLEIINPLLAEDVALNVKKISQGDFDAFCAANDLSVGDLEFIFEKLVE